MRFFQVLALTAVLVLPLEAAGILDTISDKWAARDKLFGTKLSATADSATKIPPIVTQCIDFIDAATTSHVGLEGVYKDSAPEEEMTTKIALIDNVKKPISLEGWTPLQVATALRRYLKSLPEPPISEKVGQALKTAALTRDLKAAGVAIAKLDKVAIATVGRLINHLNFFSVFRRYSTVGMPELANTFAPLLFDLKSSTKAAVSQATAQGKGKGGSSASLSGSDGSLAVASTGVGEWRQVMEYLLTNSKVLFPAGYKLFSPYIQYGLDPVKMAPVVVLKCIEAIEKVPAAQWPEGLYRGSAAKTKADELEQAFEAKKEATILPTLTGTDMHLYAGAIKKYFGILRPSLIHGPVLEAFLAAVNGKNVEAAVRAFAQPGDIAIFVLKPLLQHLKKVMAAEQTKMTAVNLGIVFGPTLFDIPQGMNELSAMSVRPNLAAFLVQNADAFIR